jgi:hypothetical protein
MARSESAHWHRRTGHPPSDRRPFREYRGHAVGRENHSILRRLRVMSVEVESYVNEAV